MLRRVRERHSYTLIRKTEDPSYRRIPDACFEFHLLSLNAPNGRGRLQTLRP